MSRKVYPTDVSDDVDTSGNLLAVLVTLASKQERVQVGALAKQVGRGYGASERL